MIWRFLKSLLLIDLMKGMWLTLKYTPQPAFTFQYPAERRPTAPRFRGVLRLQTEPATGAQTCIVCDQCAKACPDDLIALGGHREPGQKIKILDYFDFNLSRCSFCGLCAEVCPTKPIKALIMLAGIIVVMQVEGHILQPFLLGRAVKLHPLAVLLAIAIGITVGGIVGALMAVPLLAFTKSFIQYLMGAAEPPITRVRWPSGHHRD